MKGLFVFIGRCLKGIWTLLSFTRQLILNLLFISIIGLLFFLFQPEESEPIVKEKSALVLNLSGPIVEQRSYVEPFEKISGDILGSNQPKETILFDVVDTIRFASTDNAITGLVLNLKDMSETNLTKLRYIAKAINEFKAAGKPVYAVGDYYSQSQYYLASYADTILMSPNGAIMLQGYSSYPLYYKQLLDNLDVTTHIFRVGTYKSAVEPFLRNDMSDAAKESASAWLTQLWGAYIGDVAHNRAIDSSTLSPTMEHFLTELRKTKGDLAQLSLHLGLVDQLMTRQQMQNTLRDVFGEDRDGHVNQVSYQHYLNAVMTDINPNANDIAVVVASGTILDGKQKSGSVGGDSTAALLRQAREDDKVKAVVLRVDSPGGSAFASEVIRAEIDELKAAGKPVVVSMSSLAASGGYWISLSADKIIAQPTTLTGSIGIFGIITTFEKGLNKLGINSDGIGTTPFAGVGITRGISEGASEAIQLGIEHGYHNFISLVSNHRDMTLEQADAISQGRVWTGQDALNNGLVDQLGDFDDAIAAAAELAQMESYNIYWVETPLSSTEKLIQQLSDELNISFKEQIISQLPSSFTPLATGVMADIDTLTRFNDPKGQYSFCLNCSN
ncbi:signal peptide peptidase SppA [Aliivibrio kagoshimensis]|uniref:signal peptide peptidase SppA n=1 Tax=Aliivibrio kagoshimensis TaxID=2910230 RepID=UPI003D0C8A77